MTREILPEGRGRRPSPTLCPADVGDAERGGPPPDLEACRRYLMLIARRELGDDLGPKADASDLVQQTFLDAQREIDRFRGRSGPQLLGWLRRILLNNIGNLARSYRQTAKRQVCREVSLEGLGRRRPSAVLVAEAPSPIEHAIRSELVEAIRQAIDALPEPYRQAITWRYHEGCSFAEMAGRWSCSPDAARMVWARAIRRLQRSMARIGEPG